jgi:hypothetical protein
MTRRAWEIGLSIVAGAGVGLVAGYMWSWECTDLYMRVCRQGHRDWVWFAGVGAVISVVVGWMVFDRLQRWR